MKDRSDASPYQLKRFKYNSHYWILRWLSEARAPARILDIGAADGYLGAVLKGQGHSVVGVENNPEAAARARGCYDAFHVANVEKFDFPYRDEFDYILFADVLEHLSEPQTVVKNSLASLKKSGQIILSVPNIANIVMRLSLLAGRFEYADRGIMDRTHLRFFTLSTLERALSGCGLDIAQIAASPLPVQLVWPFTGAGWFAPLHELHYLLVRMRKPLFAYQFIVRAVRKEAKVPRSI